MPVRSARPIFDRIEEHRLFHHARLSRHAAGIQPSSIRVVIGQFQARGILNGNRGQLLIAIATHSKVRPAPAIS
jgi:hypothetical protein